MCREGSWFQPWESQSPESGNQRLLSPRFPHLGALCCISLTSSPR